MPDLIRHPEHYENTGWRPSRNDAIKGFQALDETIRFLFPDTRHLTPETLRFGACNL
jgi:hypothetical protein